MPARAAACWRSTIISSATARACIIDIGTGTGILAIAAAKTLGIKSSAKIGEVIASDSDPIAVAIAAANARKNGVSSLIERGCGATALPIPGSG